MKLSILSYNVHFIAYPFCRVHQTLKNTRSKVNASLKSPIHLFYLFFPPPHVLNINFSGIRISSLMHNKFEALISQREDWIRKRTKKKGRWNKYPNIQREIQTCIIPMQGKVQVQLAGRISLSAQHIHWTT